MTLIRIQNRRGNASAWESADPTLEPGELGIESDTGKFKIGDGSTEWTALPYAATRPSDLTNTVDDYVLLADVGTAGNPPSLNVDKNLIIPGASIVVEGSTDNAYETTLTVTNPTQDRTITFKDADGTVAFVSDLNSYILTSAIGGATGVAGLDSSSDLIVPGDAIIFEGSTDNAYETTLQVTDPTADRSVTIPNASGTVITTGNLTDITSVGTLSSLTVSGDLTVNGTTTTLNSTTLSVDDKNIEIGSVDTPTDTTANGGGIVLKGATDKTILWSSDSGAWTSSEDIALSAGKTLIFEGATDNTYETKLTVVDPTGDRTITFPDETGTVAIESWVSDALGAYVTTATVGSTVASLVDGRVPSNQLTTGVAFMSDVSTAQTAAEATAAADATSKVSAHEGDTTNIHGIADTSALATKAGTETFTNKTLTSPKINEDVEVTATATELNTLDGITASTAELNILDGATLTVTELNYVDGVTSAIQTQLDAKAATADIAELAQDAVGNAVGTGLSYNDSTGAISVDTATIQARVADVSDTEIGYLNGVTSAIQTQLDNKLALSGGTLTGALTLHADPASALHAATKQYVDNTASGIVAKPQVLGATTANIDATYDNGTLGVGATLTHNTNGAFPSTSGGAEGWAVGKGILVKNQTNKAQNGRYYVSDMGSPSTPYVLTRCGYCDEASEIPGAYIFVQDGTNAGTGWIQTVADATTFTVGTDDIDVFQFSGSGTITAGTGITVNGSQVSINTAETADLSTAQTLTNKTLTSPNINEAVALSATSTELNILDGATLSTTELNYVDGVTSAIQTQLNAKTPELYTFTTDSGTSRTLALADNFASLSFTGSSAITVTVPTNSAVAFPIGSYIELYQFGTAQITVTQSAGVTVNATDSQKKSRVRYSSMTLIKVDTDEWLLVGDTAA